MTETDCKWEVGCAGSIAVGGAGWGAVNRRGGADAGIMRGITGAGEGALFGLWLK